MSISSAIAKMGPLQPNLQTALNTHPHPLLPPLIDNGKHRRVNHSPNQLDDTLLSKGSSKVESKPADDEKEQIWASKHQCSEQAKTTTNMELQTFKQLVQQT